jgi:pantothenate kinase
VLVEGNYLLLDDAPWNEIRPLSNEIWYLDVPEAILLPRLIKRHQAGGKDQPAALEKVHATDLPNARLVAQSKRNAARIFTSFPAL